jgi:hypothetical protein
MMRTWNSALETIGLPPPTGEALKRHLEKVRFADVEVTYLFASSIRKLG